MIKSILLLASLTLAGVSCNSSGDKSAEQEQPAQLNAVKDSVPAVSSMSSGESQDNLIKISENRFDPVCGMPVKAGVSDTLKYDQHVLGFCSPDCKAEFVKKPADFKLEYNK